MPRSTAADVAPIPLSLESAVVVSRTPLPLKSSNTTPEIVPAALGRHSATDNTAAFTNA